MAEALDAPDSTNPLASGRYTLFDEIASGGMATVHLGALVAQAGFSRAVAIKRLHAQYAKDPEFVSGFLDEARLASRIRHPNVVTTLDVVASQGELLLVMEYVHGLSLARVFATAHERGERVPMPILIAIVTGALFGLHAAHEA
ncbi:serine/threonine protein kinase, partial [bacterium]